MEGGRQREEVPVRSSPGQAGRCGCAQWAGSFKARGVLEGYPKEALEDSGHNTPHSPVSIL